MTGADMIRNMFNEIGNTSTETTKTEKNIYKERGNVSMATKKITKKDMFNEIIKMMNGEQMSVSAQAVIDFANHEIELLNKKSSSSSGKPTKTQIENEGYKEVILEALATADKPMTISEIMEYADGLAGLKNQRVSALMTQLKNAGKVIRTEEKKKAYFSLAE